MNLLQKLGLKRAPSFEPLDNGLMRVTNQSLFSGKLNTMDLPITQEQVDAWQCGDELIQNVFYHLTDAQREFLMTGAVGTEWEDNLETEEE